MLRFFLLKLNLLFQLSYFFNFDSKFEEFVHHQMAFARLCTCSQNLEIMSFLKKAGILGIIF